MKSANAIGTHRSGRLLMQVLWPSFLVAVVAEGLFFSCIDPLELSIVTHRLGDSREAAYTIGFFLFWALLSASSLFTWLIADHVQAARDGPGASNPLGQD